MKQILIILGLFASVSTFAQSPRIKLNQITKDSLSGSVLISSPTDSGMVYSRELYISYGADTVLILNGDTLAATSGIISSVLSDGLTINGDGTTGNELEVDTSFIATLTALSDSLATVSASTTPDGVTITGDGSVGNPLKVDTFLIATIKALNDTLTNRGYLTAEVDGSISNEGSLTVGAGTASTSVISSNTSGSTDVTLTAGTNVTLSESGNNITIAATGGGTSFNNISETADTVIISGDLNVDANTLRVDAANNKVGIGTNSPSQKMEILNGNINVKSDDGTIYSFRAEHYSDIATRSNRFVMYRSGGTPTSQTNVKNGYPIGLVTFQGFNGTDDGDLGARFGAYATDDWADGDTPAKLQFETTPDGSGSAVARMTIQSDGNVGIGTNSPSEEMELYSDQNGANQLKIVNPNTGSNTRAGVSFWNGTGGGDFFAFLLNGKNYNGVTGWDDRFTVQSGSGVLNGLLFYSSEGGIQLSAKSTNTKDIYVEDATGNVFMENLQSTLVGDYDLRIETSTGEIGYNTSSVRFKENIVDFNKGLDYVLKLKPVKFNYIADTTDKQLVGFIAEQLSEIGLDEGVVYKEDGTVEGINSIIYNPILVNAIQEQQAIIETQSTEIDQLKTLITDLTNRLIILENK